MDNLFTKIQQDLTNSLKQKNEIKTSTLRLVISEIGNARIAKGGDLTDEDIAQVIAKEAKKRQESIGAFKKGERQDLAEKEEKELSILKTYLPAQIAQDELIKIVDLQIAEAGARDMKDLGKVMSAVLSKVKGRAEGGAVATIVKSKLSS